MTTPLTPNPEGFKTVTKHKDYYINGADLCLLVENVKFRVHRFFFERESPYFVRRLAIPASPGEQPQGSSDSNAILLEDVSADHFATFLWVFYNPLYSLYETDISKLEVILNLAVLWEFPEVKNLAVRELEKKEEIPDSKRIKLYHANGVDRNILIPYYARLCEREAHLTREEGDDIGMETVIMISAGRGEARAARLASGVRSPISPTFHGEELHEVIREVFRIAPVPEPTVVDPKKPNGSGPTVDPTGEPSEQDPKKKPSGDGGNAHHKKHQNKKNQGQ